MTTLQNTAKLLAVLALVLLIASSAPAFSRATHEWQMWEVFSEVEGQAFHDAVSEISWAMDNTLLIGFKREIGRVPGNLGDHRVIGHGWTLGGAIPRNVMDALEQANPGKEKEIRAWWSRESRRLVDGMAQATGLPKKQAQALGGIVWCLHQIGDRMPGNTRVGWVLPPPEIEKNLEDDFTILFRNHPEYAVALGNALRDALKAGKDEFDQSARLMETLQAAPISEMLMRCWGRTLSKQGIVLVPLTEESERLETYLELWNSPQNGD